MSTIYLFFTDKGARREKIVLVEGERIINNDVEIAHNFQTFSMVQ